MKPNRNRARDLGFYVLLLVIMVAVIFTMTRDTEPDQIESYSELVDLFQQEKVQSFVYRPGSSANRVILEVRTGDPAMPTEQMSYDLYSFSVFYEDFHEIIEKQYAEGILESYDYETGVVIPWWASILPYVLLMGGALVLWYVMMNRMGGGGAGGVARFSKARTRNGSDEKNKKTFNDVAGCDEEKEELAEIVDFLKDPKAYTAMGARIPKGVLLVGPPGTGDEIDAVGRQRGSGLGGGHDEREQTLNQLLVEMDGFGNNEGVIVMAATNRADILDNALLRPGRFDRQIYVGLPDIKGREAILKIHSRAKHLAEDVDLLSIAKGTPGFAGADLENLMNEAALLAVRRKHRFINQEDIDEAILKVQMGPEKKSRKMSDRARRLTAYHESGHAVAARYCEHVDPVHYITIIPRGAAGGFTLFRPQEDLENFTSRQEMFENIVVALGGRTAEKLFLEDISTGASGDIQQASSLARDMVMKYGMSDRLGPISYDSSGHSIFIGRDFGQTKSYSEETAGMIDEEVKKIFDEAAQRCEKILTEHAEQLSALAEYLLVHETIEKEAFDHFFETGEFPAEDPKLARQARNDSTIERPARKISMIDGYAEEAKAAEETAPETPAETETPATEPPQEPKDE